MTTDILPLETYTMLISPREVENVIEVLDQLRFLDWTAHSTGTAGGLEVEITFNQECRPVDVDGAIYAAKSQR